jgi:phage baseplate assembly protein W
VAERKLRTGFDAETGAVVRGRAHAEQSVRCILATRTDTRVMRLDFGSDLRALRGENLTAVNVLRAYAEIVAAVHSQEPEVRFRSVRPVHLDGRAGAIGFQLSYQYYPFGRLGDYSVWEDADMRVPVTALARGSGAVS